MNTEGKALILDDKTYKDGLENLMANIGTGADKRAQSTFVNRKRLSGIGGQEELNAMYRTDWIAGKVVDIIPNDMTREWRQFEGEITPETIKLLKDEEDRLGLSAAFNEAHKWARLYGTAFIVMNIDDGQTPDMPLNFDAIKLGGLKHITVIDRHRIHHADQIPIMDPLHRNFGFPESYRFAESLANTKIHHTRMIRFDGVKLPFDEFRRNNYFSDSVLDRLYEALIDLTTVTTSAAGMVYETNVDVIKIKSLMTYMATKEGEELLRKRFALAAVMKSNNNMLLLDAEEDMETKTNSFAGLPELLDKYAQIISAGSDVPATRLLGTSASGLNATGEGDLKNYYDKIRSDQKSEYKPKLDNFDIIMAKSLGISDGEDLEYEFNSLFQITPKEQADTDLVVAQRDAIYLDQAIVTEEIIAKELKQNGTYTNLDDEHIELLKEIEYEPNSDTDTNELGSEQEESEGEEEKTEAGETE